jgi:hypothetical protein
METLREAYGPIKPNDGSPKVDGANFKDIEKQGKIDKWTAARREALFKKTEDGYVFKFGRRYFLVDEGQKAELQRVGIPLINPVPLAAFGAFELFNHPNPAKISLGLGAVVAAFLLPLGGRYSKHYFKKKQINPILEGARPTEKRITWRERNATIAKKITLTSVALRGISCVVFTLLSIRFIYIVSHGFVPLAPYPLTVPLWNLALLLPLWIANIVGSGFMTSQLFYIAFLKMSQDRRARLSKSST